MARTKRKKTPVRRKRKKTKRRLLPAPGRIIAFLVIAFLLFFSIAAAGYVIFFRTAVAQELDSANTIALIFEEPDPPSHSDTVKEIAMDEEGRQSIRRPKVAVIIDDMGYHHKLGRDLINLPLKLTFSFLPTGPFTAELEDLAFQQGRPVLLHLPMQPKSSQWDPGPGALLVGQAKEDIDTIIDNNLLSVPHASGINNHMGSRFTSDREGMEKVMEKVGTLGLFFIDSFTSPTSLVEDVAVQYGVPSAKRNIFLDNVQSADKVCEQIEKLIRVGEKNGSAIGIGHPNRATLQALSTCSEMLSMRVELVDVKELVSTGVPGITPVEQSID